MNPPSPMTRREMLRRCGCGFGYTALSGLMAELARTAQAAEAHPLAPKDPHFKARARRVIFLFMHGGPSQVDTFDPKPLLTRDHGKAAPGTGGEESRLLGSHWEFARHGNSGLEISALFPELATCADDLCVIRSMHTEGQAHAQAVLKLHTGSVNQVRPSVGSWILYGLGTENQNLPGFVSLSPPSFNGGAQNYGAAFLPSMYQGTAIGSDNNALSRAEIKHVRNPKFPLEIQAQQLEFIRNLNGQYVNRAGGDSDIDAVIESFELAFRMQVEAPELTDLSGETRETLDAYGVDQQPTDPFARQCLLARRFAERGVRFIQVSHNFKWDQHNNLRQDLARNASEVDKPIAALLKDLKERGLLDDTLVIWGGEFGRTPTAQGVDGRDHNPEGFSIWMAGGGVRGGITHGSTDDYGFKAVENPVHMHDLHATILHLLGMDHTRLTFRHAGRDYRLTDVHGNVVKAILS